MSSPDPIIQLEQALFVQGAPRVEDIRKVLAQANCLKDEGEATAFVEGALVLCRRLYEAGRSFEAIPIVRVGHALVARLTDTHLKQRSASACGIVLAESGDYAGALECHAEALKLAEQSGHKPGIARAWCNIGLVFLYTATYEVALEAYLRAREVLRGQRASAFPRHLLHSSLAQCYFHLFETEAGLRAAYRALALENPAMAEHDPWNAIHLRRNCVRLLVRAQKFAEARALVEQAERLSIIAATPRTGIAALVTRAIYEVASGNTEVGLTRMAQALEQARGYPVALRDTLISMMQAEEIAGHPARAAFYLRELADTVYREALEQARKHLDISRFYDTAVDETLALLDETRHELMRKGHSPHSIVDWRTFDQLSMAACFKIEGSGLHGVRVGRMAGILALESGCDPQLAAEIGYAARFHDIGMLAVPESLLGKSGPLSSDERALMQTHCKAGVEMLSASPHASAMLAIDIARHHHEWWNGQGYPHGIKGNAIPKPARLCAVADVFDALISQRSYHKRLSIDAAGTQLLALAGTQLDPQLVDCFVKSLRGEGEAGIRRYLTGNEQPSLVSGLDDLVATLTKGLN